MSSSVAMGFPAPTASHTLRPLDDDDDDPSQLRLTFSESVDPTSTTGGSTSAGTTVNGRRASGAAFNPHVTVGGTVHASSRLAVGRDGVSYGTDKRFRLDPNDFAPLRVGLDVIAPTAGVSPSTSNNNATEHQAPNGAAAIHHRHTDSNASECVSTGNLLGKGASGSVRLMVYLPTARPVAVKCIATTEKHHFDEILSELRALCDAKTLFDTALCSPTPLNFEAQQQPRVMPASSSTSASSSATTSPSAPGFIVDFLGAWSTDGFVNIAMECMAGSLADIDPPPEPILSKMTNMLLKGLSVMHRKLSLLHRDLKPANVLFDVSGSVKVADFGVSSRLEASKLEQTATFIGSIMYMSPERVRGENYSYPSDVWALAITVAEVFLGKHPFRQNTNNGEDGFHGNHEKKFWKMVEIFTTALAFDRQLSAVISSCRGGGITPGAAAPSPTKMRSINLSEEPPLSALVGAKNCPEYAALQTTARTEGFDLEDPRIPASAGFIARICCKSPLVSPALARFFTRCLPMVASQRATVVELMSDPFILSNCSSHGPEGDRTAVSEWLLAYVPKVASSTVLAQAALDVANARSTDGAERPSAAAGNSPPKPAPPPPASNQKAAQLRATLSSLASEPAVAPAATSNPRVEPSPPASPPSATAANKSAKVRAALLSLAAEPKPGPAPAPQSGAKVRSTNGAIFSDDPQGAPPAGCCVWSKPSSAAK